MSGVVDDLFGGIASLWGDKSALYPWLAPMQSQVNALEAISGKVPDNLRPALLQLITAGRTILDEVNNGTTVSSDDAQAWFNSSKTYSSYLAPEQAAPIAQGADAGLQTPSDSDIFAGIKQAPADAAADVGAAAAAGGTAIGNALQAVEKELEALAVPIVGSIVVGVLALFVLSEMFSSGRR